MERASALASMIRADEHNAQVAAQLVNEIAAVELTCEEGEAEAKAKVDKGMYLLQERQQHFDFSAE